MIRGMANRRTSSIGWFTALMAQMFIWSAGYFFELTSSSLNGVLFWAKVEYIGAPFIAPTWFFLVLTYTGKLGKTFSPRYYILFLIPVISVLAAWTNGFHHLLWQHPTLAKEELFTTMNFTPGLWYIINIAYSYGLFIITAISLFHSYLHTSPVFRWQILLLLSFSIINWIGNAIYILKLLPKNFDTSPVVFAISIVPLMFVVFKNSFFSITPIAREVVMDLISDPFIVLDRFRYVLDFNREALKFTDFSERDILGRKAEEAFPFVINENVIAIMDSRKTEERELTVTVENVNGTCYYRTRIIPLYEKNKYLNGFVILMNDVTKLRMYASKLEEKNSELETFSRIVSHDIKNPLNTIIGLSEVLILRKGKIPEEESEEMLNLIHSSGRKIDSIIREILILSGMDTARKPVIEPVRMEDIVDTVLKRLTDLIARKKAVIIKPDKWTTVNSHAPWIEQIWINYISNAVKYGGNPPVIKIKEVLQPAEIKYLVIDNGRGLTEDQKSRLFSPFIRLEENKAEGTGLGLSIVKRITSKLGGTVGISDNPEGGSVFYFTLPLCSRDKN